MSKTTYLILLSFLCLLSFCDNKQATVNWLSWQTVESNIGKDQKKVLVWVYDDTCSTCTEAESRIYTSNNSELINNYFHAIKLGVHSTKSISTKGKTYNYIQNMDGSGYHELAAAITYSKDKIAYPTLVFLDSDMNVIAPLKGDIKEEELTLLLKYVKGDHYKEMNIESYKQLAIR